MKRSAGTESAPGNVESGTRRYAEDLTVIVPTVGRPVLDKCLKSIGGGSVLPARLIIVDQSDDAAVEDRLGCLGNAGIDVLRLPSSERSPASARNRGLEHVHTKFVAAIDDDCLADIDWLRKMEARLRQEPESIVTGRLEPVGEGIPPTVVTSTVARTYRRPSVRILSPLASANMGFALKTARRIGPFDGSVSPAEDNDWGYRALRLSIPIVFAPELVVYHVHWRTEAELKAAYKAYGWSQGAFYGKHLRLGDWSMALRIAISLWRGVRGLVRGVALDDFDLKVDSLGRLECLLPGLLAGLRGLPSTRERKTDHGGGEQAAHIAPQ